MGALLLGQVQSFGVALPLSFSLFFFSVAILAGAVSFIPAGIHAGGLRYHGMAPLVCKLYDDKVIEAIAVPQIATFQAAVQVIPPIESITRIPRLLK